MPDRYSPSEFGGKAQRNGIQPPISPSGMKGHTLTADEELRMDYATGQHLDSTKDRDDGEAFHGLLPIELAKAAMPVQEKYRDANG